jgi:hypothetical protein
VAVLLLAECHRLLLALLPPPLLPLRLLTLAVHRAC